MTEDMKSSSAANVTTSNCRTLTMQSGTMLPASTGSLQPATSMQQTLLPDASTATPPRRTSPKDMPNADFVNRLMAASRITDFYSANVAPHSFFYSEMLRSLVQSRNEPTTEQTTPPGAFNTNSALSLNSRRNRKRAWPHRYSEYRPEGNENVPMCNSDIEMKLAKIRKREDKVQPEDKSVTLGSPDSKAKSSLVNISEKNPTLFPHSSTPWYPQYPPFFIDLRVSGHIYDKNNESKTGDSPSITPVNGLDPKSRQGSAFSVPTSRSLGGAINLTTNQDVSFKDRSANDLNNNRAKPSDILIQKEEDGSLSRFESSEEVIAVDDEKEGSF